MLLQRVLTALVLIPLVFAGVLYLPPPAFAAVLGGVVLLGGHEWARLAGFEGPRAGWLVMAGLAAAMLPGYLLLDGAGWIWVAGAATGWWAWVTASLLAGRAASVVPGSPAGRVLLAPVILLPTWAALVALRATGEDGPWLVLFLLTLIWVADSAAYFVGRRWGRVKLAPAISPGKSREGVYGALAGALLWSVLLILLRPETGPPLGVALLAAAVCLVSVVGDLFESLMKRRAGLKDSGTLLPGHGGVLDRIDSLTAAAPLFLFGLWLLEGAA